MTITSDSIDSDGFIASKYTCSGENDNPQLNFLDVPTEAKSLSLIMEDPDSQGGTFTHWLLYDMSPRTIQLVAGQTSRTGRSGINSFGKRGYGGPCPVAGTHHYFFKLYALDTVLSLSEDVSKDTLLKAMETHIIDYAELIGKYENST